MFVFRLYNVGSNKGENIDKNTNNLLLILHNTSDNRNRVLIMMIPIPMIIFHVGRNITCFDTLHTCVYIYTHVISDEL